MSLSDWNLEANIEEREQSDMICKHNIKHHYKKLLYCSHCGVVVREISPEMQEEEKIYNIELLANKICFLGRL